MKNLLLNRYVIEDTSIGAGLYGTVFQAYDIENKEPVAIKITQNLERAYREVEVMNSYGNHKYLPTLLDFYTLYSTAYTIMEYIDGKPLGHDFNNRSAKKYDEKESLKIVIRVLRALQKLHESGFVHRDTKPGNILVVEGDSSKIKLIDFNTSKPIKNSKKRLVQTDLRNAARMFIYLTNGIVPDSVAKAKFEDKKLRRVIMSAFNPSSKRRYNSAESFRKALSPII